MCEKGDSQTVTVELTDSSFYICGYIICFTLIPKIKVNFDSNPIMFNEKYNYKKEFYNFLEKYTETCKYAFISIYDAEEFMKIFYPYMEQKGYKLSYGAVKYQDMTEEKRIKLFRNSDIGGLVFSKDKLRFGYQNEFRIFIQTDSKSDLDHIEEKGVDLSRSIIKEMVYLSRKYVNEIWST